LDTLPQAVQTSLGNLSSLVCLQQLNCGRKFWSEAQISCVVLKAFGCIHTIVVPYSLQELRKKFAIFFFWQFRVFGYSRISMAMNNNGAGGVQGLHLISMTRARSGRRPAENDHAVVNLGAVAPFPADGDSLPFTVGDSNPGKMKNLPPSSASPHEIGQGI